MTPACIVMQMRSTSQSCVHATCELTHHSLAAHVILRQTLQGWLRGFLELVCYLPRLGTAWRHPEVFYGDSGGKVLGCLKFADFNLQSTPASEHCGICSMLVQGRRDFLTAPDTPKHDRHGLSPLQASSMEESLSTSSRHSLWRVALQVESDRVGLTGVREHTQLGSYAAAVLG